MEFSDWVQVKEKTLQSSPITDTHNTVTITRSILKNQKTFISMARNWMLNYPCLSKHGDETKLQSFNLKEILNGSWDFT